MSENAKNEFENEFTKILISAIQKGMTTEEFFAMADTTLEHLRGKTQNETVEKVIKDTASPAEVSKMIASLKEKK